MAEEIDQTEDFFAGIAAAGHLASLEGASESIRFDVADGDSSQHWHVDVLDGDVTVTRDQRHADAVIHVAEADLAKMVTGRLNAQAAILRGLLVCTGSISAFIAFQRCLPGPPGSAGRVAPVSSREVTASHSAAAAGPR